MNKDVILIENPKSNKAYIFDIRLGNCCSGKVDSWSTTTMLMGDTKVEVKDDDMFHRAQRLIKSKKYCTLTQEEAILNLKIDLGSAHFI